MALASEERDGRRTPQKTQQLTGNGAEERMLDTLQGLESSGFLGGNGRSRRGPITNHFPKRAVVPTKPASIVKASCQDGGHYSATRGLCPRMPCQ